MPRANSRLDREELKNLRIRVIGEIQSGKSLSKVSKEYNLPFGTIYSWWCIYRRKGLGGLDFDSRKGEKRPKLTSDYFGILKEIVEKEAKSWGHDTKEWTIGMIQETLKKEVRIRFAGMHIHLALYKIGYNLRENKFF